MDASTIDLCLSVFPWAKFRTTKGAIELHAVVDHEGDLPAFVSVIEGKVHEVNMARQLALPKDSIVVFDRGYTDYSLHQALQDKSIWFVTRQKCNAAYQVTASCMHRSIGQILKVLQLNVFERRALIPLIQGVNVDPPGFNNQAQTSLL